MNQLSYTEVKAQVYEDSILQQIMITVTRLLCHSRFAGLQSPKRNKGEFRHLTMRQFEISCISTEKKCKAVTRADTDISAGERDLYTDNFQAGREIMEYFSMPTTPINTPPPKDHDKHVCFFTFQYFAVTYFFWQPVQLHQWSRN